MNKELVCSMYIGGKSMRQIALYFNTNHKLIGRILNKYKVNIRKPLNLRGKKKFNCNKKRLWNNMVTHLRFDISLDWIVQFEDFDKVKILNNVITNRGARWNVSTEWYKTYIKKFYNDKQFNRVYENWIKLKFEKYAKPSIDHIIPISKGGTNHLSNLQFLTWFENRCKNDMSKTDWKKLKQNIERYFIDE